MNGRQRFSKPKVKSRAAFCVPKAKKNRGFARQKVFAKRNSLKLKGAEAIRLVAQAEQNRIEMLRAAGLDTNILTYQSFEALQGMANGQSTTLFVPTEALGVLSALGAMKTAVNQSPGHTAE